MTDNEPFQREERYIVIKRKHLSKAKEEALRTYLFEDNISTIECVVVESDWPENETVWRMIEDRVTGRASTDDAADDYIRIENAECKGMDKGADFCIKALAETLGVDDWEQADGSETWHGDVAGTIYNVLKAGRVYDEEDGRVARLEDAEGRDALLSALGWKTGPFPNEGTRKVVLEDSAALRPAMVEARRSAGDAEMDRDMWRWIAGERVEDARSGLLLRVWNQMKNERRRRIKAEAALAHPPAGNEAWARLLTKAVGDITAALILAGKQDKTKTWTAPYVAAINDFARPASVEGQEG